MTINIKKGDEITLTKLSDDSFGGNHPNGINTGYQATGILVNDITVGERVVMTRFPTGGYFATSRVLRIVDDSTFKTEYSTYKIVKA